MTEQERMDLPAGGQPDAAPTCGKPKEDVDDLIFRADSGRTVSER